MVKATKKLVELVNINDILRNIKNLVRYKVINKITIDLDLDKNLKAIQADFSQITQVLLNLVVNALEAVDSGGSVKVSTENVILDKKFVDQFLHRFPGNYVKIEIEDTGPGINPKIANRIFRPFYTTKRSGSGLGLSVVRNILESHEGIITFSTTPGEGTTFSLYFPSIDQQVSDTILEEMELHFGSGKILAVDDNPLVRDILDQVLTHLGYEVHICDNAEDATRYYREHYTDIDVVILDYIMPDMSGDILFEGLQRINPEIKAIMVTGYGQEFDINKIHEIGISTILVKPFKMELLSKRIHDLLQEIENDVDYPN